jgi:hypothetical protein
MKIRLIVVVLLAWSTTAHAQADVATAVLRSNNLTAYFRNDGVLWQQADGSPGLWLRAANGQDSTALAGQGGIWITANDAAGSHLITADSGNNGFKAGFAGVPESTGKTWKVTRDELIAHRQDWLDNNHIDNPIASIYAWPGRNNAFFETYNGFALPDPASNHLAEFWDEDFDGRYEPNEGDYPLVDRSCMDLSITAGDLLWLRFHVPLATDSTLSVLDVNLGAYAFDCIENPLLGNSILLHYELQSNWHPDSPETLDSLGISYFWQGTLQNYFGTFSGSDERFIYSYAAENYPMVAWMPAYTLQLPPDNSLHGIERHLVLYPEGNFPEGMGLPHSPAEYRHVQDGYWRDGTLLTSTGFGYQTVASPTLLAYDGLPEAGDWTELMNGVAEAGQVSVSSFPRAALNGWGNLKWSYMLTATPEVNGLDNTLESLYGRMDSLRYAYSCDAVPMSSLTQGCELVLDQEEPQVSHLQIYPNPVSATLTIDYPTEITGSLQVYNMLGQMVDRFMLPKGEGYMELAVNNWPLGVYMLYFAEAQITKRVVVK